MPRRSRDLWTALEVAALDLQATLIMANRRREERRSAALDDADAHLDTVRFLLRLWQQARARLRPFLLARVRLDDTADLAPIARAVRACTASLSQGTDGERLADGLGAVILGLVLHAGTERTREDLRGVLWGAAAIRVPRRARHAVARGLVDGLANGSGQSIEQLVFLGDPEDPAPPPTAHAHAVLLLLAVADVVEARGAPGLLRRMRSAYGLLRRHARSAAMARGMHEAVEAVTPASLRQAAVPDVVSLALQATAAFAGADQAPQPSSPVDGRACIDDSPACQGGGPSPRGEVSSPPLVDLAPKPEPGIGGTDGASTAGDETQGPPSPDSSAPAGVSSPRDPEGPARPPQRVRNASTGGDGTETSKAPFSAGPSEVSSPAPPASPLARPHGEDLAVLYLLHTVRKTGVVPSQAECARAAGTTRQAVAKWPTFLDYWRRARGTRGGHIRRGYRNARTGDIEAESDDS